MNRAIFTSKEFLLLSLALNHALTTIFVDGMPGYSKAEVKLLHNKVHSLGMAATADAKRSGKPLREETFILRDEKPMPKKTSTNPLT